MKARGTNNIRHPEDSMSCSDANFVFEAPRKTLRGAVKNKILAELYVLYKSAL